MSRHWVEELEAEVAALGRARGPAQQRDVDERMGTSQERNLIVQQNLRQQQQLQPQAQQLTRGGVSIEVRGEAPRLQQSSAEVQDRGRDGIQRRARGRESSEGGETDGLVAWALDRRGCSAHCSASRGEQAASIAALTAESKRQQV